MKLPVAVTELAFAIAVFTAVVLMLHHANFSSSSVLPASSEMEYEIALLLDETVNPDIDCRLSLIAAPPVRAAEPSCYLIINCINCCCSCDGTRA